MGVGGAWENSPHHSQAGIEEQVMGKDRYPRWPVGSYYGTGFRGPRESLLQPPLWFFPPEARCLAPGLCRPALGHW